MLSFWGYGDSSEHEPTEQKVIEDAVFVYKWFANKTKGNVFVWGHSLGTSIAIQTVTTVQDRNIKRPTGLILEAAFNNMRDEIGEFSIAKVSIIYEHSIEYIACFFYRLLVFCHGLHSQLSNQWLTTVFDLKVTNLFVV